MMSIELTYKINAGRLSKMLHILEKYTIKYIKLNNGLTIQVFPNLKSDDAKYFPSAKTIQIPKIIDKKSLACYLHELGHFIISSDIDMNSLNKSPSEIYNENAKHIKEYHWEVKCFLEEIGAWNYVLKCIKNKYIEFFLQQSFESLETYTILDNNPDVEDSRVLKTMLEKYKKQKLEEYHEFI